VRFASKPRELTLSRSSRIAGVEVSIRFVDWLFAINSQ